jgi:hypothetical protein
MSNQDFYGSGESTDVGGTGTLNLATPGDTSTMYVRRGRVDVTKAANGNISDGDVMRVFPVYAGEIILGVWVVVDTAETTTNAEIEIGIDAGKLMGVNVVLTPANYTLGNTTGDHVHTDGNLTLLANNGVTLNSATINVLAVITKDFDYIGPAGR